MKDKANIVISYYNDFDKLSQWISIIDNSKYDLVLYEKDDNLKIGEFEVNNYKTKIPNFGRCDYAFFHYIINNYDNLPHHTVFTKIHWHEHGLNLPILLRECFNYDYYEVGQGLHSYIWYNNDNLHLKELEGDTYINVDTPYVTGNPYNFDGRARRWEVFEDWYNHIFPDRTKVPGKIYAFDHAPCFCVSRDLIRRHPVDVYQYLLERFHPSSKSWDYLIDNDEQKTIVDVGKHFHDNFVRFYRLLFTHDIDNNSFNIQQYF